MQRDTMPMLSTTQLSLFPTAPDDAGPALLLMACSGSKLDQNASAIDLYRGVMYQSYRAHLRSDAAPHEWEAQAQAQARPAPLRTGCAIRVARFRSAAYVGNRQAGEWTGPMLFSTPKAAINA
jgi:hypothetical protein